MQRFTAVCTALAVVIIGDVQRPIHERRIQPLSGTGLGVDGGEKYMVGNVFFKVQCARLCMIAFGVRALWICQHILNRGV